MIKTGDWEGSDCDFSAPVEVLYEKEFKKVTRTLNENNHFPSSESNPLTFYMQRNNVRVNYVIA
jgi:hypothetical protein